MTDEEKEVSECLDKVFAYCSKHKDTCEGCIFYREISIGSKGHSHCKVLYAPEVFGESIS